MVQRSLYIRIKNPLHKHFAGMPMQWGVGVKNRKNIFYCRYMKISNIYFLTAELNYFVLTLVDGMVLCTGPGAPPARCALQNKIRPLSHGGTAPLLRSALQNSGKTAVLPVLPHMAPLDGIVKVAYLRLFIPTLMMIDLFQG